MYRNSTQEALDIQFGFVHRILTLDDPYGGTQNLHYSRKWRQRHQAAPPKEYAEFAENLTGLDQMQRHIPRATTNLN